MAPFSSFPPPPPPPPQNGLALEFGGQTEAPAGVSSSSSSNPSAQVSVKLLEQMVTSERSHHLSSWNNKRVEGLPVAQSLVLVAPHESSQTPVICVFTRVIVRPVSLSRSLRCQTALLRQSFSVFLPAVPAAVSPPSPKEPRSGSTSPTSPSASGTQTCGRCSGYYRPHRLQGLFLR